MDALAAIDVAAVPRPRGDAFIAPRMLQAAEGQIPDEPRAPAQRLEELGVSINYRGDIIVAASLSASIQEDENCSFWRRGLPFEYTAQPRFTAAAKVVFFEETAARRFWDAYGRNGSQRLPFVVGALQAVVERNRTRVAQSGLPCDRTRVVVLSGPEEMVNVAVILNEFDVNFVYQMDRILVTTQTYSPPPLSKSRRWSSALAASAAKRKNPSDSCTAGRD
ncbi:hypothetical protein N658DRAFT_547506 [Parathielavia hyrcaniae]|uniref:Uncharacterized protein n=1 Tax=Parathielavia hyrcaniae TaxID=113614 RepID=A0AAN6T460_9PEZI|nr:hypothetical protein N658DRAFT_547506 [Parathielavia hyrcaniae]